MMSGEPTPPALRWMVCGLCFFAAWLSPVLWWLVLPAIAFFIHALTRTSRLVAVVWGSWFLGTVNAAGATLWFFSMYPLEWSGIPSPLVQIALIALYWIGVSVAIGAGMMLFGVGTYGVLRYERRALLFVPALFVAAEVLGSFCFSLYSLGDGAVPNIHFGFGYVGFLLSNIHLLMPVASVAGVYGLSAVVAGMGTALYSVFAYPTLRRHMIVGSLMTLAILCVSSAMLAVRGQHPTDVHITTIETDFASESSISGSSSASVKSAAVVEAVRAALHTNTQIILLPEDSRLTEAYGTPEATLAELSALNRTALVVDTSRWTDERGRTVLRAFYYDLSAGRVYTADKQYLVPQGEFVPYLVLALARSVGGSETLARIARDQDYVMGGHKEAETLPARYPGLLFCSESVSPYLAYMLGSERSLILHPVSHARFHNSAQLARELDAMLRVSAVWSNRTIVSAGNLANGSAYLPDGTIVRGEVRDPHPTWRFVEYDL